MQFLRLQCLTFGLVALLAVGWAQTFGLHRGFMCDCGGVEQITQMDHCHGPHSAACHEDEDHSIPHQHEEDDGDTHQHSALIESLLALKADSSQFASIAATVPAVCYVVALPSVIQAELPASRHLAVHPDGRRWPQVLAHTIALRV